jgi:hypothetical protein
VLPLGSHSNEECHQDLCDFAGQSHHNVDGTYIEEDKFIPQHPFLVVHRPNQQTPEDRMHMITDMQNSEQHTHSIALDLMIEMWDRWTAKNDANMMMSDNDIDPDDE